MRILLLRQEGEEGVFEILILLFFSREAVESYFWDRNHYSPVVAAVRHLLTARETDGEGKEGRAWLLEQQRRYSFSAPSSFVPSSPESWRQYWLPAPVWHHGLACRATSKSVMYIVKVRAHISISANTQNTHQQARGGGSGARCARGREEGGGRLFICLQTEIGAGEGFANHKAFFLGRSRSLTPFPCMVNRKIYICIFLLNPAPSKQESSFPSRVLGSGGGRKEVDC